MILITLLIRRLVLAQNKRRNANQRGQVSKGGDRKGDKKMAEVAQKGTSMKKLIEG